MGLKTKTASEIKISWEWLSIRLHVLDKIRQLKSESIEIEMNE